MRLLTHNMLQCPRTKAYPLRLNAETCDDVEVPFSAPFIRRMLPRIKWEVFRDAASQFPDEDMMAKLPDTPPEGDELDENTLRAIHRALLEWHVVDGTLTAEGGPVYVVKEGVPNLVITEVRNGGEEDKELGDGEEDDEENDDEAEEAAAEAGAEAGAEAEAEAGAKVAEERMDVDAVER